MKRNFFAILLASCALLATLPGWAHHSFQAEFDASKAVTLKGTLSKIDWINPHIYFYLDVKDDSGKVTNWTLESIPTGFMHRAGLTRDDFVIGDTVTVLAYRAKDGTGAFAWVQELTFANGRKVAFGANRPQPEDPAPK
ncbi:MAG: hypothetical protein DMG30_16070 [Acidobacteria bacterium]|nr:MAG: hypothetical protein DMG30_16070 [Acidobacteriota bacterium]